MRVEVTPAEAFSDILDALDQDGGCEHSEVGTALVCCWRIPDSMCRYCAETKSRIMAALSQLVNR